MPERIIKMPSHPMPITRSQINESLDRVKSLAAKFNAVLAKTKMKRDAIEAEYKAQLEAVLPKDRPAAEKMFGAARANKLKELVKETEKDRWEQLRELNTARDNLKMAREHYANVRAVATAYNLGSPERMNYSKELEGMGLAQLQSMALVARATHNKDLIAALCLTNDKLPRKDRPFDSAELAEEVFGPECEQVRNMFAEVDLIHTQSFAANQVFEGSKITPVQRIGAGLNFPTKGKVLPHPEGEVKRDPSLLERMSAALDAEDA